MLRWQILCFGQSLQILLFPLDKYWKNILPSGHTACTPTFYVTLLHIKLTASIAPSPSLTPFLFAAFNSATSPSLSLSLSLSLSYFIPRHTHTCFVSHLQHTPTPTQSTIVYIYISLSHSLSLSLLGGYSLSHLLSLSWCTSPPSRRKSHEVSSTISNRHLRSFARSTSALRSAQPPTTKSVDTFLWRRRRRQPWRRFLKYHPFDSHFETNNFVEKRTQSGLCASHGQG